MSAGGPVDPMSLGVVGLRDAIARGEVSATEAVRASLRAIRTHNGAVNAFTQVFEREALAAAAAVDAKRARGEGLGRLGGVPVAVKDNICLDWGLTTCGSRMLESYRSPYTATVASRLVEAGAVIVGKTNLDEFAMGSSTEWSMHGPTRNPWDLSRVPGGSSGGSAAAVAAGMVPAALGSDTGGSIRQPAGWCGVVGLKPTYGTVSRWGLVAYASSLDQIGPFARSVEDAGEVLAALAQGGRDEHDATSIDPDATTGKDRGTWIGELASTRVRESIRGLMVGVPRAARGGDGSGCSVSVSHAMESAVEVFRMLGAEIKEVELPHTDQAIAAYYMIATAEASSNLARFDGVRFGRRAAIPAGEANALEALYAKSRAEGLGPEVQRRIMLGTHALSAGYQQAYYVTALKVRRLVKRDFDRAFAEGCDVLMLPSSPGTAFPIGAKLNDPLAMYMEDVFTVGVNLAGLPALTVPAGFEVVVDRAAPEPVSLPIGLQLIGPALGEGRLLRAACMFESATTWHERRAPLSLGGATASAR